MENHKFEYNDGIMYAEMYGDVDLDIVKRGIEIRRKLANNEKVRILTDIRKVDKISKKAKDFLSTSEATMDIVASAVLINSMTTMMIGNVFLMFTRPDVPVRLFTDKEKASVWLKSFDGNTNSEEANQAHNKAIINELT